MGGTIQKTVIVLPDTSPLVHLAAAGALSVLNGFGRVIVVDVVALEATFDRTKPFAEAIAAWIEAGAAPGSNQPVEVAATEIGPLYKLALEQGLKPPRNAGEIGITAWLSSALDMTSERALVVYENGKVPAMLAREGMAGEIAIATTRNLLELAEKEGIIDDSSRLWALVLQAAPTANPLSILTLINPAKP